MIIECELCGKPIKKGFLLEDNTMYCSMDCLLQVIDMEEVERLEENNEIDFVKVEDVYGD